MQSEFDKAFKSINNKKRLTIVMGILALILLIAALFFVIKEKDNKKKNPNNQKPIIDQSSSEENPVYSSEEISNLLNINQSNNVCVDLEKIYSEIIRLEKLKKYPNIANFNTYDLDYSTIALDKKPEDEYHENFIGDELLVVELDKKGNILSRKDAVIVEFEKWKEK